MAASQPGAGLPVRPKPKPHLKAKVPAATGRRVSHVATAAARLHTPHPDRGTVQAKATAKRPARPALKRSEKPHIKLGKRRPGAEHHGPAAGYQLVHDAAALTTQQVDNILTCLRACHDKHADQLATEALMCLGFGENSWHTDGCNASNHCGVFQLATGWQRIHDYRDVGYWAVYALENGFYGRGGIIHLSRQYPRESPGYLTNLCQGAYTDPNVGARYYDQFTADARWAINTYGKRAGVGPIKGAVGGGAGTGNLGGTGGRGLNNPEGIFRKADWAGNVINCWKLTRGGANEAAHLTAMTRQQVDRLTVIGWKKG